MSKKIWYAPNQLEAYDTKEIDAVNNCLKEGWLAGNGKYTIAFEKEVATYFGKRYGLFVNSVSSACLLALAPYSIGINSLLMYEGKDPKINLLYSEILRLTTPQSFFGNLI
jgi:dTDP-4-amino-4,6-dideoxygalactose transaminase